LKRNFKLILRFEKRFTDFTMRFWNHLIDLEFINKHMKNVIRLAE